MKPPKTINDNIETIEEYPVLDDELYSQMDYNSKLEDYKSWAKQQAIDVLNSVGIEEIYDENCLQVSVVDALMDGYDIDKKWVKNYYLKKQ